MPKFNHSNQKQSLWIPLSRSLSALETWGFGLTGHVGWIGTAPAIHAGLGQKALWIWIPGVLVSVLLNLQVRSLGERWQDMAGGTPNYAARLLKKLPGFERYVALGYFIGWAAAPAIYAIILTDLIKTSLQPLGISCPEIFLKIAFTAIPFIVGFSGTKALSVLHLFFVIPAVIFAVGYAVQGIGWLAFSPTSPGIFPSELSPPSFSNWAKWFFVSVYSVYSCETASSFVADSQRPDQTLRFLSFAAWLIPVVFLSGPMVLTQLATQPGIGDDVYLNLSAAAKFFWGSSASFLVTLLIAFSCFLSSATAICNTPRILYQLSLDKFLAPVFSVVSRRGVLEPALLFTFLFSLVCLVWGDVSRVVMVTGTSYLISMMGFHLGLWLCRGEPGVRWAGLSLSFFFGELVILIVGGLAWNWQDLLIGLLLPILILAVDEFVRYIPLTLFNPKWWLRRYEIKLNHKTKDYVTLQVIVLLSLICSATTIGWSISAELSKSTDTLKAGILAVLLITLSFLGVAIACWTSLPQVAAIADAREVALQSQVQLALQAKQLELALHNLQQSQSKLVQSEKMSSLGQLVAGVAHEINNPVNFIYANLDYTSEYIENLLSLLQIYQQHYPHPAPEVKAQAQVIDLNFLIEDLPKLLTSMKVGAERIKEIVLSLRTFSRLDEAEIKKVNIHEGIDSTLMILQHRLNSQPNHPRIEIIKEYRDLPLVECYAGQINQVFLNILTNAIDALEESVESSKKTENGQLTTFNPQIRISTQMINSDWVLIEIADNGPGIPESVQQRLYDPFFTTKPVGKGTGLGLSISYDIVTAKHQGQLQCISSLSKGTKFVMEIPIVLS